MRSGTVCGAQHACVHMMLRAYYRACLPTASDLPLASSAAAQSSGEIRPAAEFKGCARGPGRGRRGGAEWRVVWGMWYQIAVCGYWTPHATRSQESFGLSLWRSSSDLARTRRMRQRVQMQAHRCVRRGAQCRVRGVKSMSRESSGFWGRGVPGCIGTSEQFSRLCES